ncbi:MAG: hypothetical protein KF724_01940 [Phycisphaeraceae bacterium]|nr:hypothetical protein [Phycisphaeraceae bacterium]
MKSIIRTSLVLCVSFVFSAAALAQEVVGTYTTPVGGGLWLARVNGETGTIEMLREIARDAKWTALRKLAVHQDSQGHRTIGVTAPVKGAGNLLFVTLDRPPQSTGDAPRGPTVMTPQVAARESDKEPDEIRATRDGFLIGADDGLMLSAKMLAGASECPDGPPCLAPWSMRGAGGLSPSGSKAEDIWVRPDGASAWITLQKDSRNGQHRGHRLIRVALPDLRVISDFQFDRDREAHHPPNSPRDHGPGPEIVREDATTNTLIVTLDNYGTVLLTDLDAALEGRLENSVQICTAADGSAGNSYPDRVVIITRPGASLAVVANAGPEGGVAVIDLKARQRVGFVATRPGLESLTVTRDGTMVVAAAAGKVKARSDEGAQRRFEPAPELVIIDLSEPSEPRVHTVQRPAPVLWISPIAGTDLLLLLEQGKESERDTLTVVRLGRSDDRAPIADVLSGTEAPGRLGRSVPLPQPPQQP